MTSYGKNLAHVFNSTWDGAAPWRTLDRIVGAKFGDGGDWLDFACGTGDLLARAHAEGFACAGADISRAQLRYARESCPKARFRQGAMQSVRLDARFDVVTCLGDSIHHLQNRRELKQFFENAKRHLKRDGVFVFDFNTFVKRLDMENPYTGGAFTFREPGQFVCCEFEYDERAKTTEWTTTGFVKEGNQYRRFEEVHPLRAHPVEEVEELLGALGFRFKKYDPNTKTMRPRKDSIVLYYKCWRA